MDLVTKSTSSRKRGKSLSRMSILQIAQILVEKPQDVPFSISVTPCDP